ncbi:hypothetical protein AAG570_003156 [Ranatra chinensis]|uniref:DDT domain-containing protein n=1 Tax=Ranatra chinensis TaxID=642074 RepID=A0ABD0Y620_9HEMI
MASLCERRSLIELAEDVYLFVKDRYFIGETVEANLPDGSFGSCHILAVIPPTNEELENYEANNVKNGERYWPPATLYKYEVETMDEKELTISADQIFRKKTAYNKDKNRLYIKQFVHLDAGYWRLKESSNTKYGISRVKFDQIFCGNPPDMKQKTNPPLKKKNGTEKGKRQETLNKYFKQTNVRQSMSPRKSPKKGDIRGSRLPSKFSNQKRRRRTKKEMEDASILQELPIPNAVETKIPIEYFGDVIMIMEFLESFKKILNVRDFFPHGVNLDIMERALLEEEVAGPLCDLIQLFLAGIFDLQDQESEEIRETDVKINPNLVLDRGDANTMKMLRKATASEAWVRQCHGANVSQLVLDTSTLSEILRLHLLTSGARKKDKVAKWRYQARGGYCNYDDPAIVLKLNKPHIIQHLGQASICELPIGDKIIVLNCLMNQILTYSAARDILEEGLTKVKQYRAELRGLNGAEAKRGRQKEQKTNEEGAEEDNSKSLRSNEGVKEKVQSEIAKALAQAQILPLGMDRAFRRFWVFQTLPGLFVERSNEGTFGTCLPKGTPNFSDDSDKILYVRKLFEEGGDKENFSEKKLQSLQVNSPSKKLLTENNDAKSPLVLRYNTFSMNWA